MTGVLNSISGFAYRLRHSRIASIVFVLGLIVCIGLIALARADNWEDTTIYGMPPDSSPIAYRDRYVRVSGVLAQDQAYQTHADVGGLKLSGGRYLPLTIAGRSEPLFVYDANVPAPNIDGLTTIVGKLQLGTGAQPPFYIEVGNPPDLPLQNVLARIGIALGSALLLVAFISWLIARADYALSTMGNATTLAPSGVSALWFGSLGAEFGNATVRHARVQVRKTAHALQLESEASRPPWAVRIHDLRKVAKTNIATAYGTLPGARIEFEDERGLIRKGTLVIADLRTQNELGALWQGTTNWK